MNDTSKLKMFNPNLSRVEDLEQSPEWTSLTNEINDLEKMCHLNNHRPSRRLRYNYHRHSMPQMQKATSVWIEPNNDHDETCRWSWRPKTEFERSYFFDDYDQHMDSNEYQKQEDPMPYENQSRVSFKIDQNFDRNEETPYSGTRERLHEIFERNRYLRRKFFASIPDNDSTSYVSDSPKNFEQKNSSAVSKYNSSGFGSTETLTSQSNQSSISSSNDRKSRCQLNMTPELVEEETESLISNESRPSKNDRGKLKPSLGNEMYLLKESNNFYDSKENSGLSSSVMPERGYNFRKDAKTVANTEEFSSNRWNSRNQADNREMNPQLRLNELPRSVWHKSNRNDDKLTSKRAYGSTGNFLEFKPISRANKSYATLINEDEDLVKNGNRWTARNNWDFCKSLPNLSVSEPRIEFVEQPNEIHAPRENSTSLTLRRVKVTKVPAPLDLSRVNERYEEVEALERKILSNYTVDVSLLRNYDCPLQGLPTIIQDESSDDNGEASSFDAMDSKRVQKDPELSTVEELQSPQLVKNYKYANSGSTMDLRQSSRLAESETRVPLSNHRVNSISGLQAGTGTTLPLVYGPIPYSQ